MKIKTVEFKKSVAIQEQHVFVEDKKEVVFVGRSNVGKSSLLNALFWKKNMAYVSAMPGKTQTANVFLVNSKYFFTDLPGYGYARGGKEKVKKMDELITWYITEKKAFISTVILLIDSKIGPQNSDIDMYSFLKEKQIPILIALTKVDKLSNNQTAIAARAVEKMMFWEKIVPVSSTKWKGMDELCTEIEKMLK